MSLTRWHHSALFFAHKPVVYGVIATQVAGIGIWELATKRSLELSTKLLLENDLPNFHYEEISNKKIHELNLEKINTEYHLYTSILDLNDANEIRESLSNTPNYIDLRKSVLVCIQLNLEVRWKKSLKCIQFQVSSPFADQGLLNNLSEIVDF